MSTEYDPQNDALDKILAALRKAAPPEGMEARIAQRLQQHVAAPPAAPFRWREAFADSALASAWWRGAVTGAAAVLLVSGALLVAGHLRETHQDRVPAATDRIANGNVAPAAKPVSDLPHGAPGGETPAQPCAQPVLLRTASVVPIHTTEALRVETYAENAAPSRPAPPLPLTAQERALIRLVQTSNPGQLAILNPEEYANLEARSVLKFEKFFAPPAPSPAPDGNAATTSISSPEANSEGNLTPGLAAGQEAGSENKSEINDENRN